MSSQTKHVSDVFLSHASSEGQLARKVAASFRQEGLEVFDLETLDPDANIESAVWESLAECLAVVAIIPVAGPNANMTFELGAARAWQKPTYFVASDLRMTNLGAAFAGIPVYPLSRLDDVVRAIKSARNLTDADRETLSAAYAALETPLDRLITNPPALDGLVQTFRRQTGKSVAGEVLVLELLRMRKKGHLTPLGRTPKRQNPVGKA